MNDLEIEPKSDTDRIQGVETQAENETQLVQGAQMLENPKDDSFVQGLQTFIDWVKSLVADDTK